MACFLSASNCNQIFIPEWFTHGHCMLEPNTEVIYEVGTYVRPSTTAAPSALAIARLVWSEQAAVSDRDLKHPARLLAAFLQRGAGDRAGPLPRGDYRVLLGE
jgi:dTDP-4-dehydrorhamnose 3,5-epimerase-like enzyme